VKPHSAIFDGFSKYAAAGIGARKFHREGADMSDVKPLTEQEREAYDRSKIAELANLRGVGPKFREAVRIAYAFKYTLDALRAELAQVTRERDEARAQNDREVRQFNDGFDAALAIVGTMPKNSRDHEPSTHEGPDGMFEPDEDSWAIGFAWGGYERLADERDAETQRADRMTREAMAARAFVDSFAKGDEYKSAWDAYDAIRAENEMREASGAERTKEANGE